MNVYEYFGNKLYTDLMKTLFNEANYYDDFLTTNNLNLKINNKKQFVDNIIKYVSNKLIEYRYDNSKRLPLDTNHFLEQFNTIIDSKKNHSKAKKITFKLLKNSFDCNTLLELHPNNYDDFLILLKNRIEGVN